MQKLSVIALTLAAPLWALELRVTNSTVPPGGAVQIQVSSSDSHPVMGGRASVMLDPAVFSSVEGVSLFSQAGDAAGVAVASSSGVAIRVLSPKGSLGVSSEFPMMTIVANTKSTARVGSTTIVSLDPEATAWYDSFDADRQSSARSGVITFGGSLWVSNIAPGGGPLPAGKVVKILGGGFTAATTVQIEGVNISSRSFVNANEIDITLGAAVDLTAARVRVKNPPDSFEVTYYSFLRSTPIGTSSRSMIANAHPLFPNQTTTSAFLPPASVGVTALALQNPTQSPVAVLLDLVDAAGVSTAHVTVTMPADSRYVRELSEIFSGTAIPRGGGVKMTSPTAIQALGMLADETAGTVTPVLPMAARPATNLLIPDPSSLTFESAVGGSNPASKSIALTSSLSPINYTATISPANSWLSLNTVSGATPGSIAVSAKLGSLVAGLYPGLITLTGGPAPIIVPVQFRVGAAPGLSVSPSALLFTGAGAQRIEVESNGGPLNFTVSKSASWISLGSTAGVTPAKVSIDVDPTGLSQTVHTGQVTVTAGSLTKTVTVALNLSGSGACTFVLNKTAATAPASGDIGRVEIETNSSCSWTAASSAEWIAIAPTSGSGKGAVRYTAAPNTAAKGRTGTIIIGGQTFTVTQAGASCVFSVSPAGFVFTAAGGTQTLNVTAGTGCAFLASTSATWLTLPGGAAGTGSGPLTVTAPAYTGTSPRAAAVTIGGQIVPVVQKPATPSRRFDDVPAEHNFNDFISLLKELGITSGCTSSSFCPDAITTRGQMAVFIIRSVIGGDTFGFTTTPFFTDVPATHPFFKYIQKMKDLGVTTGCSATTYCPDAPVSRGQMAIFLVRAKLAVAGGQPFPFTDSQFFSDVATSHPYYSFIQKLKEMGVTAGCSASSFCPDDPTTRAQMAAFLIRSFFTP